MWYVIHSKAGKENIIKIEIEKLVPREAYDEIKIISSVRRRKYGGVWKEEAKRLFPGYIFVITDNAEKMHECLKKVPNYTRILGDEEGFIPILPEEERLLKKLIARTEREKQKGKIDWQISNSNGKKSDAEPTDDLIGMSYGVIENDEVVVADGPLKGFEGRIVKIDRHKREVYLDIPFLGELRRIRLGLEIVEKK